MSGGIFAKTGGDSPPVAPKRPPDTLPSRLLSGNGSESDPSSRRRWRFHQGADRVEDHAKLGVVFPFESVYLAGQFLVGYKHPPHPDKSTYDGDIHLDSPLAVQDAGEHCDTLLGECIGHLPPPAPSGL